MRHGRFLVARIPVDSPPDSWEWVAEDQSPFGDVDAIDFLLNGDAAEVYALYRREYAKLGDRFNVPMPEALLEYNRWLLFTDDDDAVVAFIGLKTTESGLKVCLLATDGGRDHKRLVITALNEMLCRAGVFAEVSGRLEEVIDEAVPRVVNTEAASLLGKPTDLLPDGYHYSRHIGNVGIRTKLLVGRPHKPRDT